MLDLNWSAILSESSDENDPPPLLIVKNYRSLPDINSVMINSNGDANQGIESMRDDEIESAISRLKTTISVLSSNLKDKGARIINHLRSLEIEHSRRKERRSSSSKGNTKPQASELTVASCLSVEGRTIGAKYEKKQSTYCGESTFGALFTQKMEDKDGFEENAFHEKLDNAVTSNSSSKIKRRNECILPGSQLSASGSVSCVDLSAKKTRASETKKSPTVVLVDEDEMAEGNNFPEKVPDSLQNVTIYYPSRDDAESVEICYSDTSCLEPDAFVTSPIMNFYIRYLQLHGSLLDRSLCNYHFFNTFFYEKLKQALSHQGKDRLFLFSKFRRWWKGVDIFQKAYVFIPIHDEYHWSLVIVCIPDKEDESGPIVLHLDSLGFHCSLSVFDNIKRYLIREWEFINQEVAPVDVPIADKIWKLLPRRIEEKKISVPQQKNVYDCGLFVLFFMERFMEEAPERLKKKDLSMFGRKWFKAEEASMLRVKIRGLVVDQFKQVQRT